MPNLYPALVPAPPRARARGRARTCSPRRPARGAHEVIVNAPAARQLARRPGRRRRSRPRWTCGARACARTRTPPYRHLIVNERARGRRVAAAHPRAALRARLRPRRDRPRARALQRLRGAHDGRQPARRPRAGGGPPARADRRDRRRGRADGAVRLAGPVPADARPAPRRARASRTTGPPAPRCCTTACSRLRRLLGASPPLNLWVRTAPQGAEHFCWRIDVLPRLAHLAGLELGAGRPAVHRPARDGGRAAARSMTARSWRWRRADKRAMPSEQSPGRYRWRRAIAACGVLTSFVGARRDRPRRPARPRLAVAAVRRARARRAQPPRDPQGAPRAASCSPAARPSATAPRAAARAAEACSMRARRDLAGHRAPSSAPTARIDLHLAGLAAPCSATTPRS